MGRSPRPLLSFEIAQDLVAWSRRTTRPAVSATVRSRRGRTAVAVRGATSGSGSATAQPADLVLDALTGPRDRLEPLLGDRLAGHLAHPVGAEGELVERVVDLLDLLPGLRREGQVALTLDVRACRPRRTPRRTARRLARSRPRARRPRPAGWWPGGCRSSARR